jgi:cell wall assembly regulator SMI1
MSASSMTSVWRRLEEQFSRKYHSVLKSLRSPASLMEINAFEELTGHSLPQDIRESYLIHDGTVPLPRDSDVPRFFSSYEWCHLERSAEIWTFNAEMEYHEFPPYSFTEIEDPDGWNACAVRPWEGRPPTWLPLGQFCDDRAFILYVDVLPGPSGRVGQLVNFQHSSHSLVVPSLSTYLEGLARSLESDQIRYDWEEREWRYLDGRSLIHDNEANPYRRSTEVVSKERALLAAMRGRGGHR